MLRLVSVLASLSLSMAACPQIAVDGGDCANDNDCKGDRICESGKCVTPDTVGTTDGTAGDTAPDTTVTPDATPDTTVQPDTPTVDSATPDADATTTPDQPTSDVPDPPDSITTPDATPDATPDVAPDAPTADGQADSGPDGVVGDGGGGDLTTGDTSLACLEPNPQGCIDTGCPAGETCETLLGVCTPSSCSCTDTGEWGCTKDCGGGTCVPSSGGACTSDADCTYGAHWCVEGTCQDCDNSGTLCFIACQDGSHPTERNGCTPCQCVLDNACKADEDCPAIGSIATCQAGPVCLPWCDFDDPSCCYGNSCEQKTTACDSPNPQACTSTGCAPGLFCEPSPLGVCMASACFCDESSGVWGCTDDCVSGVCVETQTGIGTP